MPKIEIQDTPQDIGVRPSEIGIHARDQAARRVGSAYREAAEAYGDLGRRVGSTISQYGDMAVKHFEHEDISKGTANFAELSDNLTKQWTERTKTADANDPDVAKKFREEVVDPELEKFNQGFVTEGGQKWAENHAATLRNHMYAKTSADMSMLAGIAVKQNYFKTVNTLSSTVRTDPSSVDFAMKTVDSSVAGVVGTSTNLSATDAATVKTELMTKGKQAIVQSYIQGVAEKNPEEAQKILESGKYSEYISGPEAKQLLAYSRAQQRLGQSEARNNRVMTDYVAKQEFHKAANELELSTAPANPGDRPVLPADYWKKVRELGQMPGAQIEPGRLKTMVENGERITERLNKPEPMGRISHDTTMGLLNRIRANDGSRLESNEDIYKAYGDGKLNTADFNFLVKEFKEIKTPQGEALSKDRDLFFKQYASTIDPNYTAGMGSAKVYYVEMAARRLEAEARSKGLDAHVVYDPTSPYFIGDAKRLTKFMGDMQSDLRERASAGTTAEPSKPGKPEVPMGLRGVAALSYSRTRNQWRDDMTGKVYNADGSEAAK